MKIIKKDGVVIHELSSDDVQRLELGVLIPLGNNHYLQAKDYVEKMLQDELDYNKFNEEYYGD